METISFYLVESGRQAGPFSFSDLKLKKIEPDTLIWYEGLEKWKKAKEIPELSTLFRKMPPPIDKVDDESPETRIPPIPSFSETKSNDYELATIGQRFGGYLLTQVITLILFFVFGGTLADLETSEGFWLDMLYAGIVSGIFNGIFYPFFAGNLGHKLLGLIVIKKSDGSPVKSFFSGYGREFFKGALSIVIIPVIWLIFDNENQNFYDKIQDTIVVKNNE
jgi:uncharacterized RDD family membrane protein YckC